MILGLGYNDHQVGDSRGVQEFGVRRYQGSFGVIVQICSKRFFVNIIQ